MQCMVITEFYLARQLRKLLYDIMVFNDYSILKGEAHHQYYNFLYFCECLELQYNICMYEVGSGENVQ